MSDGKYPRYLRFVDRQIARSIHQAAMNLAPARMKLGLTDAKLSPSIAGMQVRTGGRPPAFFDDELRVLRKAEMKVPMDNAGYMFLTSKRSIASTPGGDLKRKPRRP